VADLTLTPAPLLGGYQRSFGATDLREATDLAIVSLAVPQGDEARCATALDTAYGCAMPDSGRYVVSNDGQTRVIRTAPDQLFVLFPHAAPNARAVVATATGDAFWSTDQTDNWCALELSGPQARAALARICMLNLHPQAFGPDHAARTVMEHMGAMILRSGDDAFLLLSARSSAKSFLHAVETSVTNVSD